MTSHGRPSLSVYLVACSIVGLLGSCSSSRSSSGAATSSPADSSVVTTTTAVASTTTQVAATSTAAPATTAATTPPTSPAAVAPCATTALTLSLGESDGAMGSIYTPLVLTNTGDVACTLDGHPGVSFVDDAGNQVGPSAERSAGPTPTVALPPGGQAHATLQSHDAGLYADECAPVAAARLKLYPPDQTTALFIAFPVDVCTGTIAGSQFVIGVVSPGITG
jgi:hypothetical protein